MTEKQIFDYLKEKLQLSDVAIAGIMGNLYAESALRSTNLQQTYEKKLGFTDAAYTDAVDAGTYDNFIRDSAGYGLAQWTYWSRKQSLLNYAKKCGKSIGDCQMQLDFLVKELTGSYKKVIAMLKEAKTVLDASNTILLHYEKPANQGEAVQKKRAGYGEDILKRCREDEKEIMVYIGHASQDENKDIKKGLAGDQTEKEVYTRGWYSGGWTHMFRAKDLEKAELIAQAMEKACINSNIGYDQGQRTTLYSEAEKVGFDLLKIEKACECDCSSLVAVCVNAAGISVSKDMYTGNAEKLLKDTKAFMCYTAAKYLTQNNYLKRGDILLKPGHIVVVLGEELKEYDLPNRGEGKQETSKKEEAKPVTTKPAEGPDHKARYRVQVAACKNAASAENTIAKIKKLGFCGVIIYENPWYKVCAGLFDTVQEANARAKALQNKGYTTYVYKK